jgi:hypothetical protein
MDIQFIISSADFLMFASVPCNAGQAGSIYGLESIIMAGSSWTIPDMYNT